jgi:hypothetical protein
VFTLRPRAALACNGLSIDHPTASGTRLCRVRWPLGQHQLAHYSAASDARLTISLGRWGREDVADDSQCGSAGEAAGGDHGAEVGVAAC